MTAALYLRRVRLSLPVRPETTINFYIDFMETLDDGPPMTSTTTQGSPEPQDSQVAGPSEPQGYRSNDSWSPGPMAVLQRVVGA